MTWAKVTKHASIVWTDSEKRCQAHPPISNDCESALQETRREKCGVVWCDLLLRLPLNLQSTTKQESEVEKEKTKKEASISVSVSNSQTLFWPG